MSSAVTGNDGDQRPPLLPFSPPLRRRVFTALPTLFVIVTLTFVLVRAAPGGPFGRERDIPEAARANIEARFGLDRPIYEQYVRFWGNLLTGSLGPSFQQPERSAFGVLVEGLGPSLIIGLSALLIALMLGMGGGTLAALWSRSAPVISILALMALSVPVFVLGPILIRFVAVSLGWFPAALWGSASHVVLPALTLGIPVGGALTRFWRAVLTESMELPECVAARSRGLGQWQLFRRHAARRSLPPLLNYVGPMLATLVTGSVIVEQIFDIPGMGHTFIDSALMRDYPVVIGATLIYLFLLLVVHTLIDLSHLRLDPRLRKEHIEWTRADRELRRKRRAAARELRRKRRAAAREAKQARKAEA